MQEIEVKILEINKDEIIKKLVELGAEKVFDDSIEAVYFDLDDNSLSENDRILRLRKKGEKAELTFKEGMSRDEAKIMKEFNTEIDDFESMKRILEGIGFKEFKQVKKRRISYLLGDVRFEIDTLPNIPTFLEIEAPSLAKLRESADKLGFSMDNAKPWSVWEVLGHYGKS